MHSCIEPRILGCRRVRHLRRVGLEALAKMITAAYRRPVGEESATISNAPPSCVKKLAGAARRLSEETARRAQAMPKAIIASAKAEAERLSAQAATDLEQQPQAPRAVGPAAHRASRAAGSGPKSAPPPLISPWPPPASCWTRQARPGPPGRADRRRDREAGQAELDAQAYSEQKRRRMAPFYACGFQRRTG